MESGAVALREHLKPVLQCSTYSRIWLWVYLSKIPIYSIFSGQNIRVHITGGSPQSPTTSVRGTLPGVRGMFAGFAEPSRGL